jgi:hypothetical protein
MKIIKTQVHADGRESFVNLEAVHEFTINPKTSLGEVQICLGFGIGQETLVFTGDYARSIAYYLMGKAICKDCGTKDGLQFSSDPYRDELHDDPTPVWMCEKCRKESADEI